MNINQFIISIYFFSIVLSIFSSCVSSKSSDQDFLNSTKNIVVGGQENELKVLGDNIPVYADPAVSEPLFLLNSGTKCNLIERGPSDLILDAEDFWYKIDYQGKKGWIFGEKTSLRRTGDFNLFLKQFDEVVPDTLSVAFSKNFLGGRTGFKPMEYSNLDEDHIAALFLNNVLKARTVVLLMVYQFGKPVSESILYEGNTEGCTMPEASFTSENYIKLFKPSCNNTASPISYYQFNKNFEIKEIENSINSKTTSELIKAIENELKSEDISLSRNCNCIAHSSITETFATKQYVFYTVIQDQCSTICSSGNYTLMAFIDNEGWSVKYKKPGGFKAIFESGITGKYILVLEQFETEHIVKKKMNEKTYLFDPTKQTLVELNLSASSCMILSPTEYGCKYCKENTSHKEELIFKGNPVETVIKKIADIQYDELDGCKLKNQQSQTISYYWEPQNGIFIKSE